MNKIYRMENKLIPSLSPGKYNCKGGWFSVGWINLSLDFDMNDEELCKWCDQEIPYTLLVVEETEHGNGD